MLGCFVRGFTKPGLWIHKSHRKSHIRGKEHFCIQVVDSSNFLFSLLLVGLGTYMCMPFKINAFHLAFILLDIIYLSNDSNKMCCLLFYFTYFTFATASYIFRTLNFLKLFPHLNLQLVFL